MTADLLGDRAAPPLDLAPQKRRLVTPEQLQAMVDVMGLLDHGADWKLDGRDGKGPVWTGKLAYEEKYRKMLSWALPIIGVEV